MSFACVEGEETLPPYGKRWRAGSDPWVGMYSTADVGMPEFVVQLSYSVVLEESPAAKVRRHDRPPIPTRRERERDHAPTASRPPRS